MIVLVRNNKGRIFKADRVQTSFNERDIVINIAARFDYLPGGSYTHYGVRYPDGHETWALFEGRDLEKLSNVGWGGISPLNLSTEIKVS